ncbi:MAG TPA: hypothetical protein V6D03_15710 [Candidatus Caenarcaniphilales bacterium]
MTSALVRVTAQWSVLDAAAVVGASYGSARKLVQGSHPTLVRERTESAVNIN